MNFWIGILRPNLSAFQQYVRRMSQKPLKHRDVVSNFIFKRGKLDGSDKEEDLVALFRRSDKVRTYQGKLAPISGSVETTDANSLATAVRELHEETQLVVDKDIKLEFSGKPFSIIDEQIGRSWTIYPFGWKFSKPSAESSIKIDWEHSGWEWVSPEKVLTGEIKDKCVPDLDRSLGRVFFGPHGLFPGKDPWVMRDNKAGRTFLSGLENLQTDHENGARVLATNAVKILEQILKNFQEEVSSGIREPVNDLGWWYALRIVAWHLIYSGRPSMNAAISSAVLQTLRGIVPSKDSTKQADFSDTIQKVSASITEREKASGKISNAFQSYIESLIAATSESHSSSTLNILTLSSSSTIRNAVLNLIYLPNLTVNISILESRPLCEGASLASSLSKLLSESTLPSSTRFNITLAPDSHVSLLAQHNSFDPQSPSLLLLGADRISPSGHVSNKMGSLTATLVTKTLAPQTKVVVLSEGDKIAKSSSSKEGQLTDEKKTSEHELKEHSPENNSPEEVTRIYALAGAGQNVSKTLSSISTVGHSPDAENDGATVSSSSTVSLDIKNVYFEWVPSNYIDVYISEDGEMTRQQIWEKSQLIGELEQEILEDLYND